MDYMEDSDGDMYDLRGDYPPPYAQHDIGDDLSRATRSGQDALMRSGVTSVGRIIVATVVVYVTWVTLQVVYRWG